MKSPGVRELLQGETGLCLAQDTVERAVRERMRALGIEQHDDYLRCLRADSPGELKALTELVVVPESWMFRDRQAFEAATRFVGRRLAGRPDRPVRILCIPCAGGEEPYSMAMALDEAGIAPSAYSIEGIDLSVVAIERARAGLYTRNAFRGRQLDFRERYFVREGDAYRIGDQLRARVRFSEGNLMTTDIVTRAGAYDIVFCRNLLIYFDDPTASVAIARLHALLADDGLLFAGFAEVPAFCRNRFSPASLPGAFALQKELAAAVRPAPRRVFAPRRPPAAVRLPSPPAVPLPPAPCKRAAGAAAAAPELLARARALADQGDLKAAAAACHAVLAADSAPGACAGAYFILGLVSECDRQAGLAQDYWRRCVYLQPDHYEALCHLALLAGQDGDDAAATRFRQRAARVYGRRHGQPETAAAKGTR